MVYHHLIRCSGGRELLHHGLAYEQRSEQQGLPTRVGVAEETGIPIYDLFDYSSFLYQAAGFRAAGEDPTNNNHIGVCILYLYWESRKQPHWVLYLLGAESWICIY